MNRIKEMQEKLKAGGVELRTFSNTDEFRAAGITEKREGESDSVIPKIEGYAAVFNSPSDNLGYFVETIRAGAFDGADFSMCKAVWNHNDDIVLGSMSGNTLSLEVNERGLFYSTTPRIPNSLKIRLSKLCAVVTWINHPSVSSLRRTATNGVTTPLPIPFIAPLPKSNR